MSNSRNGVFVLRIGGAVFACLLAVACGPGGTAQPLSPGVLPPVTPFVAPVAVELAQLSGTGAETCFNGTDDNDNGLLDEGCAVEQGRIQFLAAWQDGAADVDLHVTGPSGQVAEVGSRSADGLTKMRDCPGEGQECQGRNQENVLLDGPELAPGQYVVRLRLEDLGGAQPPIVVRLGVRLSDSTRAFQVELVAVGAEAFVRLVEKPASVRR